MNAQQAIRNIKELGFTPIDPPTFGELFRAGFFDGETHEELTAAQSIEISRRQYDETQEWLRQLAG